MSAATRARSKNALRRSIPRIRTGAASLPYRARPAALRPLRRRSNACGSGRRSSAARASSCGGSIVQVSQNKQDGTLRAAPTDSYPSNAGRVCLSRAVRTNLARRPCRAMERNGQGHVHARLLRRPVNRCDFAYLPGRHEASKAPQARMIFLKNFKKVSS